MAFDFSKVKTFTIPEGKVKSLVVGGKTVWRAKAETDQLTVPTISLDGDTLTMTATDPRTEEFVIFVDGVEKETVAYMEFDLSTLNLSAGTHKITVKARASGYTDSPASDPVGYVVELTPFVTNVSKIEIEANDADVFNGTSQVVLSGGSGNYTVSDAAITSNKTTTGALAPWATTSLVNGIYTINWHINVNKDSGSYTATDVNGKYTIYFSDGITTLPLDIIVDGLLCLTGDALITLADGSQKRIDQITLNDKVLAINPETGELCEDIITFTDSDSVKKHYHYNKFVFEDGTVIKTVHRHRFYNIEEQQMSHLDLFYVGDHVYKQDGTTTRLVSGEEIEEDVQHYTIFTRYQNYFVNGILSGNRFTPYMSLGNIPEQETEIEGQGVPVFNGGGGTSHSWQGASDISLLFGSK